MSAHKHLTLEDRIMIHRGLDNSSSRKSIADIIGKDKSTVCKERSEERRVGKECRL